MKRIEFIAPVEAMRGKLSGNDPKLQYAENNNPAFDAPDGRQYAKNYAPKYIGAKRASNGLKYFSVKTKSATLIDKASKKRMSLLAVASMFTAYIMNPANFGLVQVLAPITQHYIHDKENNGFKGTLRAYIWKQCYNALLTYRPVEWAAVEVTPTLTIPAVSIGQPFSDVEPSTAAFIRLDDKIIDKYWPYLAQDGIFYKVAVVEDGETILVKKGRALLGETFGHLLTSQHNNLTLTKDEQNNIEMIDMPVWLSIEQIGTDGVTTSTVVTAEKEYAASSDE